MWKSNWVNVANETLAFIILATGASFVSYNSEPKNYVNSFVLNLKNIKNKKITGPYHIIQSLDHVLKNYNNLKKSVITNKRIIEKKYNKFLIYKKKKSATTLYILEQNN